MKFDLAIVEDSDFLDFAKGIVSKAVKGFNQQHHKYNVVLNEDLSKKIFNDNYEEVLTKFEKFEGNLIICLDLYLGIVRDDAALRNIISRFDTDYGITEQQLMRFNGKTDSSIDGILLAEKAMLNKKVKKILIIPFTKATPFVLLNPIFNKIIAKLKRQNDVIFIENTKGSWFNINTLLNSVPIEEQEQYEKGIIKFITDAFNNLKERFIDPVEMLSKELIRGCQIEGGHPARIDQIPTDMVCYEKLVENVENFKALYYPKDSRGIMADLFSCIFEYAGIQINWKTKPTKKFYLPTRPGMIFVVCLVDFLRHMDKYNITVDSIPNEENKTEIIISFELTDPERFKQAVFTGGGTGIEKYRNLLGCKKEIITRYIPSDIDKDSLTKNWYPAPMDEGNSGNSPIYKCLLKWEVDENNLNISWVSRPS